MSLGLNNEQGRRADLQKFGYGGGQGGLDLAETWRLLRDDFPAPGRNLELSALADDARAAAERYCAHRATLDALMDRCDEIHLEIFRLGPDAVRVETYAEARDLYEDAVERFGELRVAVQAALSGAPKS